MADVLWNKFIIVTSIMGFSLVLIIPLLRPQSKYCKDLIGIR